MQSSSRFLLAALSWGLLAGAFPTAGRAESAFYQIDPAQSRIQIADTSRARFDFGGLTGAISFPILTQIGSGGIGSTLPGIGPSAGLATTLQGTLLVDLTGDPSPTQIQIVSRRTSVSLGNSGRWLPGTPDPNAASNGQIAGLVGSNPFGFEATLAVRGAEFALGHDAPVALTDEGGGTFSFGYGANGLGPVPVNGTFDYDTNFGVPLGHAALLKPLFLTIPANLSGTYSVPAQGPPTITLPIQATVNIDPNVLRIGTPLALRLDLTGQIVATRQVPEPGAVPVAIAALLTLAALRRRQGGESS